MRYIHALTLALSQRERVKGKMDKGGNDKIGHLLKENYLMRISMGKMLRVFTPSP